MKSPPVQSRATTWRARWSRSSSRRRRVRERGLDAVLRHDESLTARRRHMAAVAPWGALERARVAARGDDFRKLSRSASSDRAATDSSPSRCSRRSSSTRANTAPRSGSLGRRRSPALPFTLLGPFVGVFIDRWRRRRILRTRRPKVALVDRCSSTRPRTRIPFYVGALAGDLDQPLLPRDGLGGRPTTRAQRRSRRSPTRSRPSAGRSHRWWASSLGGSSLTPAGRARSSRSPPSRGSVRPCSRSGSGPT